MISIVDIADDVAKEMATARLPQPVLPERVNHPRIDREELTSQRVLVSPRTRTSDRISREDFSRRHTIDIAFASPVDPYNNEQTDPLVRLAEAVADWFDNNPVLQVFDRDSGRLVRCVVESATYGDGSSPLLSREVAESSNMFLAVVSLVVQVTASK